MKKRTLIFIAVALAAGAWAGGTAASIMALKTVTRPLHAYEKGRAIGPAEFRGGEGTFAGLKGRFALADGRELHCSVDWGRIRCPRGVAIKADPPKPGADDTALGLI